MSHLRSVLLATLHRFAREGQGTVAVIFAVAAVPLIAIAGLAIDYSRVLDAQERFQGAADATVLAVATELSGNRALDIQAAAERHLAANAGDYADVGYTVEASLGPDWLEVAVDYPMPTTFLGVIGRTQMPIRTVARSGWGMERVEVALVLDNTGSMGQQGRMAALQEAAKSLITTLEAASVAEEDSVLISLVPFEVKVRYADASWNDLWLYRGSLSRSNFRGCFRDRPSPNNTTMATPDRTATYGYPATTCSVQTMVPLTDDFDGLRDAVDDMDPGGNTNVTIGVMWGINTLTPEAPLTQARPMGTEDLQKIMIVLTDGDNTEDRFDNVNNGRYWWEQAIIQARIDARTAAACETAKNLGIRVYTIRLIQGNESLLRGCASDDSYYYNVRDVDDLQTAFDGIAKEIWQLRLTM